MSDVPYRNDNLALNYEKIDFKVFGYYSILLAFFTFCQIFCPGLCVSWLHNDDSNSLKVQNSISNTFKLSSSNQNLVDRCYCEFLTNKEKKKSVGQMPQYNRLWSIHRFLRNFEQNQRLRKCFSQTTDEKINIHRSGTK